MLTTVLSKSAVRDPQVSGCSVGLCCASYPHVFDSLRTVTNAIFYHLSFNCQAKSLVSAIPLGGKVQGGDPFSAASGTRWGKHSFCLRRDSDQRSITAFFAGIAAAVSQDNRGYIFTFSRRAAFS